MSIYRSLFDLMLGKWIRFNNKDYPSGKIIKINSAWIDYLNTYQLSITIEQSTKETSIVRIPLENDSEDFYIKFLRGSLGTLFDSDRELEDNLVC
ncbi:MULTISPECIES: hypothetical protein [unclassified Flammeovirga]|uniref:hypothetical protein n=1 Tax=unclassified Flammeovirga TaxID=2637820 RepID=UPI0012E0052E|nr:MULTISPECIES: hypothetical protein [unclassified Flammeovirga]MBD0403853.1 hypothetical protein [Flammeovirga sp. EKP202]